MNALYETQATAVGGRDGAAATADGKWRFNLSIPRELGGHGGDGVNPEQLFALGYAACFLTAIRQVAAQDRVEIASDTNVTATVALHDRDGHLALSVSLLIDLPGIERDAARGLIRRAHETCPYSRATHGNLDVRVELVS
ncbi:organic hydroperoxide resistance protein [Bradyrhizobium diazoefficiens]|nr:organic hydroperoxide resistance protein [Bradyrhizobium diazoefficiens]